MSWRLEIYYENTSLWTSASSICQSLFSQPLINSQNMPGGKRLQMFCLIFIQVSRAVSKGSHVEFVLVTQLLILNIFWEHVTDSDSPSFYNSSNILAFTQKHWSPLHFALTYIFFWGFYLRGTFGSKKSINASKLNDDSSDWVSQTINLHMR